MEEIAGIGTVTAVPADAYGSIDDENIITAEEDTADLEEPEPVRKSGNIMISIETIILSALIFVGILSWFEFLRSWYDNTFTLKDQERRFDVVINKFWYAIFISALVIILIYILFSYIRK